MALLKLIRIGESGLDLYHLVCEPDDEVRASYVRAGQFLQIERADHSGFFAIASAPEEPMLDLLIKRGSEPATTLTSLEPGAALASSPAQGAGFPLPDAGSFDVQLLSMGSGLAPLRALIQRYLSGRFACRSLTLWQGSFTAARLPFPQEYEEWRRGGVRVELCLDEEEAPGDFRAGTVLENFAQAADEWNADRMLVLWIGSDEFGEAARSLCDRIGVPSERVLTNR